MFKYKMLKTVLHKSDMFNCLSGYNLDFTEFKENVKKELPDNNNTFYFDIFCYKKNEKGLDWWVLLV